VSTYAYLWIGWIVAFLAIEFSALAVNAKYTLSDFVWRFEDLGAPWTFARYFIAAFLVWLALHMVFGLFR
jgi:hypothetical protein